MSTSRKITMRSSDGKTFEVEEAVALQSQTIRGEIEAGRANNGILIPNVTGEILSRVIEYCRRHVAVDQDHSAWDAEFVNVDQDTLRGLIMAAYHLNIQCLRELTGQRLEDMIRGQSPQEMAKIFGIKFSAKRWEEIRRENPWAFE